MSADKLRSHMKEELLFLKEQHRRLFDELTQVASRINQIESEMKANGLHAESFAGQSLKGRQA